MFIIKKNYYLYIDNTKSINLDLLRRPNKFIIIYRNAFLNEDVKQIVLFRKKCERKKIKFYIANHYNLAKKCKADGLYLSSYNNKIYHNIKIIGSAHNHIEIHKKIKQKCKIILLSRIFKTDYKDKKYFLGISKFNLIIKHYNISLIPLGGIRSNNLLKMSLVNSDGFAIMSEIKKKPAIASRLF